MSVEQPVGVTVQAASSSPAGEPADAAGKPKVSRGVKIGAAAAGIGSAAIVAALLYASRSRKAEPARGRGEPEDQATD